MKRADGVFAPPETGAEPIAQLYAGMPHLTTDEQVGQFKQIEGERPRRALPRSLATGR